jgi:hypothetical protein
VKQDGVWWNRTVYDETGHHGKTWGEVTALASNRVRWKTFTEALGSSVEWQDMSEWRLSRLPTSDDENSPTVWNVWSQALLVALARPHCCLERTCYYAFPSALSCVRYGTTVLTALSVHRISFPLRDVTTVLSALWTYSNYVRDLLNMLEGLDTTFPPKHLGWILTINRFSSISASFDPIKKSRRRVKILLFSTAVRFFLLPIYDFKFCMSMWTASVV